MQFTKTGLPGKVKKGGRDDVSETRGEGGRVMKEGAGPKKLAFNTKIVSVYKIIILALLNQ
jgi:hypothetical protein